MEENSSDSFNEAWRNFPGRTEEKLKNLNGDTGVPTEIWTRVRLRLKYDVFLWGSRPDF